MGSTAASSAQLKRAEIDGSRGLGVKMGDFSTFSCFSVKLDVAECISGAVTMVACAGDFVGGSDSKTAHESALFSCPMLAGGCESCGELALVERVGGCKTLSLGTSGLA